MGTAAIPKIVFWPLLISRLFDFIEFFLSGVSSFFSQFR